jgi:hypothetical protein
MVLPCPLAAACLTLHSFVSFERSLIRKFGWISARPTRALRSVEQGKCGLGCLGDITEALETQGLLRSGLFGSAISDNIPDGVSNES